MTTTAPPPARPRWTHYLWVWIALVLLTALSFLLSLAHLGGLDAALSLLIAVAKSTIVLLFFMHLIHERFSVVMVPILAVAYVGLLLSLMLGDVLGRRTFPRTPVPLADTVWAPPPPPPPGGSRER